MIHYHPHCIAGRVEQLFPDKKAPLAQLAEQVTLNHWVSGSIPERCTFTLASGVRLPADPCRGIAVRLACDGRLRRRDLLP